MQIKDNNLKVCGFWNSENDMAENEQNEDAIAVQEVAKALTLFRGT